MLGSFSSKFSFGKGKLVVPVSSNPNAVYGTGGATWVSSINNAPVNDGWTLLQSSSVDDGYINFSAPFTFYLYGTGSTSFNVGSNTYITLGSGTNQYSSLSLGPSPIPAIAGLHLGSADNSYQRVWYKTTSTTVQIRYEGNGNTGGTSGTPGIVYETTFYKSNGTYQYIQISFGSHNKLSGVFGITSGQSGSNYLSFATAGVTPAQYGNYVVRTDPTGNSPTIYAGVYTP